MKKFEEIRVGDQLELTAARGAIIYGAGKDFDPNRIIQAAIVTHVWYDPVENKDYVALATIKHDGSYGRPTEKRTITGLARTGWQYASKDWVEFAQAVHAADKDKVVRLHRKKF